MSWVKLDDLLPHHRKIMAAGKDALAVLGLYTAGIAFCQRARSDGEIHNGDLRLLCPAIPLPSRRLLEVMVRVGLWEVTEQGYQIHNYLVHNLSVAEREARDAGTASRMRSYRDRLRDRIRVTNSITNDVTLQSVASTTPLPSPPIPSRPKNQHLEALAELRHSAVAVLDFLNLKAGRDFRPSKPNLGLIEARLRSGATVENCKGIIARKCRAWAADPKMREYLRPATLFNATKFESYLGEREPVDDLS